MRIFRMFGAATLIVALLVACGGPIKTAVSVTGTLSINISGLPAGVDGSIFVFGNNFGAHVTESQILDELLPGSYSVLPVDVTVGEQRFVAPEGSVVVEQDAESEFVVAYQLAETQTPTTGSLELQITGLPAEVDGSIYVFGDGFGAHVTESQILGDLLLGRYSVLPVDVMVGEQRFIAPEGSVVVEQDAESEFVVAYQLAETQTPTTGSLEIQITGLPDGILADVGVTHPGGFNTQITAGIDFPALLPGSYSIQANPVQAGFDTYIATGGAEYDLVAGATERVEINYTVVPVAIGTLEIAVEAPAVVTPELLITGPRGFSEQISGNRTFSGIAVGSYLVSGGQQHIGTGQTFAVQGTGESTVLAGEAVTTSIRYVEVFGSLDLTVESDSEDVNVEVYGPLGGLVRKVTAAGTHKLENLPTGDYQIVPVSVTDAVTGHAYRSRDFITVTVQPEQSVTAMVTYAVPKVMVVSWGNLDGDIDEIFHGIPFDLGYIVTTDIDVRNENSINAALSTVLAGDFDLLVWRGQSDSSYLSPSQANLLDLYLQSGGRVIFSMLFERFRDPQDSPVFKLLGGDFVSVAETIFGTFQFNEQNVELAVTAPFSDYARLDPSPGSTSVCTIAIPEAPGESCGILANGGRSLWLSFPLEAIGEVQPLETLYSLLIDGMMDFPVD